MSIEFGTFWVIFVGGTLPPLFLRFLYSPAVGCCTSLVNRAAATIKYHVWANIGFALIYYSQPHVIGLVKIARVTQCVKQRRDEWIEGYIGPEPFRNFFQSHIVYEMRPRDHLQCEFYGRRKHRYVQILTTCTPAKDNGGLWPLFIEG